MVDLGGIVCKLVEILDFYLFCYLYLMSLKFSWKKDVILDFILDILSILVENLGPLFVEFSKEEECQVG